MANNNHGKWSGLITDISHAATVADRASPPCVEGACRPRPIRGIARCGPIDCRGPRSSAGRTRHGCRGKRAWILTAERPHDRRAVFIANYWAVVALVLGDMTRQPSQDWALSGSASRTSRLPRNCWRIRARTKATMHFRWSRASSCVCVQALCRLEDSTSSTRLAGQNPGAVHRRRSFYPGRTRDWRRHRAHLRLAQTSRDPYARPGNGFHRKTASGHIATVGRHGCRPE